MAAVTLAAYYEDLMDKLPRSGLAAARAMGLISRIASIIEGVNSAIGKAKCIAERSTSCRAEGGRVCPTGCAAIYVAENALWKYKSNAFSAVFEEGALKLSTREVTVLIERGNARIYLPSYDGKEEIVVELRNVEGIMREYYTIMYALKKVEEPLRKAVEALNACSKEKQLAC
ncbi:MAG: hypothetical protein LRS46_01640 [Desulfurococcales archaeon]|nr:hypothetical protein [Desulfurococcales archaeon]